MNKQKRKTCACGQEFLTYHEARLCKDCRAKAKKQPANRAPWQVPTRGKSRFNILRRDKFQCIYCGNSSIEDASELCMDHVVPHVLGGDSVASNMVTACRPCNSSKNDSRLPQEEESRVLDEIERRNKRDGIHPLAPINPWT